MKPGTSDMIEGPQALARFEDTMKALFSKRKAGVAPPKAVKQAMPPKKNDKPKV
ncbi:MAG: hypothetical protein JST16_02050 [Bdellovibrionales bacterium]|nr:hypothetical protein [Bdellovibrionales bacterium]